MLDKFRIDKKLGIDKKYVSIGIVTVCVGIMLFLGYEIVSRSGIYLNVAKNFVVGFLNVIKPITTGAILAYLLFPPVRRIEKLLMSFNKTKSDSKYNWVYRIISIIIVFFIIILSLVLIFNFIVPPLLENAKSLINSIPQYENIVMSAMERLNSYFVSLNIDYQQISGYIDKITSIFGVLGERVIYLITNSIYGLGNFIIDLVLAIIFTFYFLKDKEMLFVTINKFGRAFIPTRLGKGIKQFIFDLDEVVGGFIRGVLLDAVIVAIVSSILMLIINHPFAILVGVIAGVCNIIPYIGPLIGGIVAFVLGIFTSTTLGIWGFVLLLLYQQIDGNIIQPKIVGGSVGLPAVWTLISLTIGGGYGGAVGMILAVPVAGILSVYVHRYYKKKLID
ncbi:MAG: AI-2E family transporter [Clostridium sp.]|uniref:AI-2E family transporter n=1 Tax=Clostridium sp. TaxID=1506 RepID=UPI003053230E